jgi:hypothetical protein
MENKHNSGKEMKEIDKSVYMGSMGRKMARSKMR